LWLGGWLNLVLFALNLIPAPPLDGSRILAACSQTIRTWYAHPNAGMAGLIIFFLLMTTNVFSAALLAIAVVAQRYVNLVS
ncbi:MAG: M50 family metallopeptidase, partial [Phycisphaerales bacterium]|nr:M50 family metallopeptidase [Phycisphaerales bacterium]